MSSTIKLTQSPCHPSSLPLFSDDGLGHQTVLNFSADVDTEKLMSFIGYHTGEGLGKIILCLDRSSSMQDAWKQVVESAKTVTDMCHAKNVELIMIQFNHEADVVSCENLAQKANGYTDFGQAFVAIGKQLKPQDEKVAVIIMTDGCHNTGSGDADIPKGPLQTLQAIVRQSPNTIVHASHQYKTS